MYPRFATSTSTGAEIAGSGGCVEELREDSAERFAGLLRRAALLVATGLGATDQRQARATDVGLRRGRLDLAEAGEELARRCRLRDRGGHDAEAGVARELRGGGEVRRDELGR